MKKFVYFLLLILFCTGVFSCTRINNEDTTTPSTIRVGVLPGESREKLQNQYKRLLEYLSRETKLHYELLIPETYQELLKMFHNAKIDLALFGGYTFVKAHNNNDAYPLIMRDVDIRFTSCFMTRFDHPGKSISDFKDTVLSFGSKLSTSGHLMPRLFLSEKNIKPETFFSEIRYSGAHDKTAYLVRDGVADLGVANSETIDYLFQNGDLKKKDIRIIGKTHPYADYVWAVQSSMGKSTKTIIRNAFLNLSQENKNHKLILDDLNARYFIPAGLRDFAGIKSVVENLHNRWIDRKQPILSEKTSIS